MSWWRAIALEAGLMHPDRTRALVLVDSVGLGKEIVWFLRLGSLPFLGEYFARANQCRMAA